MLRYIGNSLILTWDEFSLFGGPVCVFQEHILRKPIEISWASSILNPSRLSSVWFLLLSVIFETLSLCNIIPHGLKRQYNSINSVFRRWSCNTLPLYDKSQFHDCFQCNRVFATYGKFSLTLPNSCRAVSGITVSRHLRSSAWGSLASMGGLMWSRFWKLFAWIIDLHL